MYTNVRMKPNFGGMKKQVREPSDSAYLKNREAKDGYCIECQSYGGQRMSVSLVAVCVCVLYMCVVHAWPRQFVRCLPSSVNFHPLLPGDKVTH